MKTTTTIKIDLLSPGVRSRIYAVQGDTYTREVAILLYAGGKNWTVPDGLMAAIGYQKPDDTVGLYDFLPDGSSAVNISENAVTVILAAQMLTVAGTVEVAVTLADSSGNQLTTFAFDVIVAANPGNGAVKSEDYFNYVNPMIQSVIEQAAAATEAANIAADRANASAEIAEDAYALADTANQKADALREVVSKFHSNIIETASGEVIQLSDASDMELAGLRIFGKTVQNGTPTPEAPVPLESVGDGGSVGVTMAGKNLLTAQQMYNQASGYLETTLDGRNCVRMTSGRDVLFTPGFLKPNTQYTVSMLCKNVLDPSHTTASGNNLIMFIYDDGTKSYLYNTSDSTDWVEKTANSKAGKTVVSIGINPYDYRTYTYIDVDTFQFEEGATTTKYEPYKGQPLTIQKPADVPVLLPGIPVESGGNYTDENGQQWICDYVDFEKGKYVQWVNKAVFVGSADVKYSATYARANIDLLNAKDVAYVEKSTITNRFAYNANVYRDTNREPGFCQNGPGLMFRLDSASQSIVTDATTLKAWLDEHPLEVVYILAEPVVHDLSAEELAQYATLHTNYPNTTIFNDGGADMEVKYVADTKLYVDKKFAELAAAWVSGN